MKTELPESWRCLIPLSEVGKQGIPWTGGWHLTLEGNISYWGEEFHLRDALLVDATAFREEKGFLVNLSLSFKIEAPCSRCLGLTSLAIDEVFRYFYTSQRRETEPGGQGGDAQTIFLKHFGSELNVTRQIWESLILSLPSVLLCADDCKGICPGCGKNLNFGPCSCSDNVQDPRLEKLREFKLTEDQTGDSGEGGN